MTFSRNWRSQRPLRSKYRTIPSDDVEKSDTDLPRIESNARFLRPHIVSPENGHDGGGSFRIPAATIATFLAIFATIVFIAARLGAVTFTPTIPCRDADIRKEWRALSLDEKHHYAHAVMCLSTTPSETRPNSSLYDDFAWLHIERRAAIHHSASFLPWHRFVLHVYERALKKHCGYKGTIPYWDWTLDWSDLANSSIWDAETGFGGDGDPLAPIAVGDGHCVTDGLFAGLSLGMSGGLYKQHCLSRHFADGANSGRLNSTPYSPENVDKLLASLTFEGFAHEIEMQMHNYMHFDIGGDFSVTAANDPIFILHHAQLDMLWWRWQQMRPKSRSRDYSGPYRYHTKKPATLGDILEVGDIADKLQVLDVMDTSKPPLCYRYQ